MILRKASIHLELASIHLLRLRGQGDMISNYVRSSLPINRATDVPISSSIIVTFDTNYVVSMNIDTVLTIVPSVEGTATFDAVASTLVFVPSQPLKNSQLYKVTVGNNGLTCNAAPQPTALQFQFTTIEAHDLRLCVLAVTACHVHPEIILFKADGNLDQLKEAVKSHSKYGACTDVTLYLVMGSDLLQHKIVITKDVLHQLKEGDTIVLGESMQEKQEQQGTSFTGEHKEDAEEILNTGFAAAKPSGNSTTTATPMFSFKPSTTPASNAPSQFTFGAPVSAASSTSSSPSFTLGNIDDLPIAECVPMMNSTAAPTTPTSSTSTDWISLRYSCSRTLAEAKQLLDIGVLSQDEFDELRNAYMSTVKSKLSSKN